MLGHIVEHARPIDGTAHGLVRLFPPPMALLVMEGTEHLVSQRFRDPNCMLQLPIPNVRTMK
jgi:hypothetical protein